MSYKKDTISVLVVSTNQEESLAVLNKAIPGLQTSDNQTFNKQEGEINVECFLKFPGSESHRKSPDFADLVITSVSADHEQAKEIVSYVASRYDAKYRVLIEEDSSRAVEENILIKSSSEFPEQYKTLLDEFKVFNEENKDSEDYNKARYFFNVESENKEIFYKNSNKAFKIINVISQAFDHFKDFDLKEGLSENNASLKIVPENIESKGLGIFLDLIAGEEFTKENPVLPLTVRDNAATITIEIKPKDVSQIDTIKETLEQVRDFASAMGLLQYSLKYGLTISISSDEKAAYIDLTLGGIFGEVIINKIKSLNLEQYKLSVKDNIRVQTNLNLKDLYKNPEGNKLAKDITTLSIVGEGKVLNCRSFFHLIRSFVHVVKSEKAQKSSYMLSYGLLALSCFEKLDCNIVYNHEQLLESLKDLLEEVTGSPSTIDENVEVLLGFLPVLDGLLSNIGPMISQFEDGIKAIDFDRLTIEVLSPVARVEFKTSIVLPGLTNFVNEKLFNEESS